MWKKWAQWRWFHGKNMWRDLRGDIRYRLCQPGSYFGHMHSHVKSWNTHVRFPLYILLSWKFQKIMLKYLILVLDFHPLTMQFVSQTHIVMNYDSIHIFLNAKTRPFWSCPAVAARLVRKEYQSLKIKKK